MKQSPSWEHNSRQACQNLPVSYGSRRFITVFSKPTAVPLFSLYTSSHFASLDTFQSNLYACGLVKWCPTFRVSNQNVVCISVPARVTCANYLKVLNLIILLLVMYGEDRKCWSCPLQSASSPFSTISSDAPSCKCRKTSLTAVLLLSMIFGTGAPICTAVHQL